LLSYKQKVAGANPIGGSPVVWPGFDRGFFWAIFGE
jgi:hypothetical protein